MFYGMLLLLLTFNLTHLPASHHHHQPPCNHESLEEARARELAGD